MRREVTSEEISLAVEKMLGYMYYTARKYVIPGKLTEEDLICAANTAIWDILEKGYDLHSDEFDAVAKEAIAHVMMSEQSKFYTQGRDISKEASHDTEGRASIFSALRSDRLTPLQKVMNEDEYRRLVAFYARYIPEEFLPLYEQLVYPSEELYAVWQESLKNYQRRPSKIPTWIYSKVLNWSNAKTQYAINQIREYICQAPPIINIPNR